MRFTARVVVLLSSLAAAPGLVAAAGATEGQMTWAMHVTLAPSWLDPAETEAAITPFMVLYAVHDAVVKLMPGGPTPSLAETWTMSHDGLTYEFVLRNGAKFHNGDPVTAEDVKFSFERYKGGGAKLLKEKVREVQVVDPRRVRFHLKESWPDFMTFYGTTATGAGWIVPKKYAEGATTALPASKLGQRLAASPWPGCHGAYLLQSSPPTIFLASPDSARTCKPVFARSTM